MRKFLREKHIFPHFSSVVLSSNTITKHAHILIIQNCAHPNARGGACLHGTKSVCGSAFFYFHVVALGTKKRSLFLPVALALALHNFLCAAFSVFTQQPQWDKAHREESELGRKEDIFCASTDEVDDGVSLPVESYPSNQSSRG